MRTSSAGRSRTGCVAALTIAVVATVVAGFGVDRADAAVAMHTPVATAAFHMDIAVDAGLHCDSPCVATLYYRTSDNWVLPPLDLYTSTPMTLTAVEAPSAFSYTAHGVIPSSVVDTRGVDYLFSVTDGSSTTWYPGPQPDGTPAAPAYHVRVLEPPHLVHQPTAYAYFAQDIPLTATSNCATGTCVATLVYATSGHPQTSTTMNSSVSGTPTALGTPMSFSATIPAAAVTTEGVDYHLEITDGYASDSTVSTHVLVLAPTQVLHVPVVTTPANVPVQIEAVATCSNEAVNCHVTLSYRQRNAGTDTSFATMDMRPGAPTGAGSVTKARRYMATIPKEAVTTRGLDYYIHATDGFTNAYSPGTSYAATGLTQTDGTGLAFWVTHTAEPIKIVHQPVAFAYYNTPITINAYVNCATPNCTGTMSYRTASGLDNPDQLVSYVSGGPSFSDVTMSSSVVQEADDYGTVLLLTATIPADAVTTQGVDYYINVTDGSTHAFYPGTAYVGGSGPVDGMRAAWQHVEVLSRPTIVHAPPTSYVKGTAIPLSAVVTTSTGTATATLYWLTGSATTYNSVPLTVTATNVTRPEGTVYNVCGLIPVEATQSNGIIQYYIRVNDSHQDTYAPLTAATTTISPRLGYLVPLSTPALPPAL